MIIFINIALLDDARSDDRIYNLLTCIIERVDRILGIFAKMVDGIPVVMFSKSEQGTKIISLNS